jgi:hypothetical protein
MLRLALVAAALAGSAMAIDNGKGRVSTTVASWLSSA